MSESPGPSTKMPTEAEYMECIRNCHQANKNQIEMRQNRGPFVETQTGLLHIPTNHLVRRACDRYHSGNPLEVCRYIPNRFQRDSTSAISSDSIEYRYIMHTNPALKVAADKLVIQKKPASVPASVEVIDRTPSSSSSMSVIGTPKKVKVEIVETEDAPCPKISPKLTPKGGKRSTKKTFKAKPSPSPDIAVDTTSVGLSASETVKLRPRLRERKRK